MQRTMDNDLPHNLFFDFEIFLLKDELIGKITGGNKRQVLVVAHAQDLDAESDFLKKILLAVKIDADRDISLLVVEDEQPFLLFELVKKLSSKIVILFGMSTAQCGLNLNMNWYQAIEHGGVQLLLCHQLRQIASNQLYKRNLWSALQQIFPKTDA